MTTNPHSITYAAPEGRAGAAGTPREPASLAAAIAALIAGPGATQEVRLLDGIYRLSEPIVLTGAHGGEPGRRTRVVAAPGAKPVLSTAWPITEWHRLDHHVQGLSDAAAAHVWYADVTGPAPRTLYDGSGMLGRARLGPLTSDPDRNALATPTRLFARPHDLSDWSGWCDWGPELFVIPSHVWQAQYLPIRAIDATEGTIDTTTAGTYPLIADGSKNPRLHYWVENVPEGLSAAGQWIVDPARGRLYLWPRAPEPDGIVCPSGAELLRFDASADGRACHDVEITGLTFSHGDRVPWPVDRRAPQHDWQIYDWPDAMVRVHAAHDVTIRDCRFVEAGATGIRIDGSAVGNVVERCRFDGLGGNAVAIVGGEPGAPERVHHNEVRRNRIRDIGRLWWQASGIIVAQSGHTVIADNHLSDLPYGAITLVSGREGAFTEGRPQDGRNGNVITERSFGPGPRDVLAVVGHLACRQNVVEHNEIHDIMQRLGDGNAIYVSGTGWGNVVRANYVHDIPSAGVHSGIRTDDHQWYTLVEQNVICRVNGGGLTLKDVNDLVDNVIVDCTSPAAILVRRSPAFGANIRRNIIAITGTALPAGEAPQPFYGGGGFGGDLREPAIDGNLLWWEADPGRADACLTSMRKLGKGLHDVVADPRFVDAARDDFRLAPDSPAWAMGIRAPALWGVRPEES